MPESIRDWSRHPGIAIDGADLFVVWDGRDVEKLDKATGESLGTVTLTSVAPDESSYAYVAAGDDEVFVQTWRFRDTSDVTTDVVDLDKSSLEELWIRGDLEPTNPLVLTDNFLVVSSQSKGVQYLDMASGRTLGAYSLPVDEHRPPVVVAADDSMFVTLSDEFLRLDDAPTGQPVQQWELGNSSNNRAWESWHGGEAAYLNGAVYLTQPNGQIWRVEPASNSSATTPEANIISPIATETIEVGGDNLRGTETPGIAPDPTKDVTAEATQTPLILLPTTTPESNVVIPNATETPASTPSSQQETPVPTETPMSEPIVEVNQGGNTGRSWYREEIEPTDQVEVVSPIATNFQPFGATAVGELLVMVGVANDSQTPGVALVNPDTGEHLWFAEDMFAPAIAADDEHVYARQYVQSSDPEGAPTQVIVALSIHTGEVVWSHELVGHVGTDDPSKAGPVLSGGVVYMPDTMGRINAYDAETGEVVWEQPEALVELSPDAVSTGGRLVFTDTGMYLTAGINTIAKIDAATGEVEAMEILSAPDEPAFSSIELLSNGYDLVAIGTIQKQVGGTTDFEHYSVLMTVDKLRLEPLWSISFTQLLMGNVVAAPNVLLAPVIREDGTKGIVRINPTTGDPLHEDILLPESAERISLSVAGEAIYSVDTDGMLRMYSLASGEMRHEASIGEPFPGAPPIPITFTPGQAVAVNEDGTVYLITWR